MPTRNKKPIPKPRQSVINKKRKERLEKKNNPIDFEFNEDELDNFFNENLINFNETIMTDVINQARDLLDFNYIIVINGKVYKHGELHFENFNSSRIYSIEQLNDWIEAIQHSSDMEDWEFTGEIIIEGMNKFKTVVRSRRGMGINNHYTIDEYLGNNCYIPTSDFCFIKCYRKLIGEEKFLLYNIQERFNQFLLKNSNRQGVMSNAKMSSFNKEFNETITHYEPDQRKYTPLPKSQSLYTYVYYLHFNSPSSKIGHYCLINKNNPIAGIKEVKDNFKIKWKTCDEKVSQTLPHKTKTDDLSLDTNTYIYDLETYSVSGYSYPYSFQLMNLNKFNSIIGEHLNSEDDLPIHIKNRLLENVSVFVGEDCVDQAFKYLGEINKKQITLIAHNGSGFDNYVILQNSNTKIKKILKTSRGILTSTLENPYTIERNSSKWQREINKLNKQNQFKTKKTKPLQEIRFQCSIQHVKNSLDDWGINFKIPKNIRKLEMDIKISDVTKDNYLELRDKWEPYAKNDILSLAACISKYNKIMKELIKQTMAGSLTSSSITFKGFFSETTEPIHSHIDVWTRSYIRRAVKGGRVSANIQKFRSAQLEKIKSLIKQHLKTDENCEIKLMQIYKDSPEEKKKTIASELKEFMKCIDVLMDFDAVSLYPSAMADENSEYPKAESAVPITEKDKEIALNLFNKNQFRPRCGIFTVLYKYPENLFFQPIPAKDKTAESSYKNNLECIRFRNGVIHDTLTSVDIQEIVRCGGTIIKIYDGIYYKENFQQSPFREYVKKLFELRLKYKHEKNKVGDELIKLLLNSLYGKTVQKDITTVMHLWNEKSLENNYTENIKNYEKIKNDLYAVEEELEETEFNNINTKGNFTKLMPSHLGAFILSHSKRIMNNFILTIDGFRKPEVYYTDTDSIYISNKNWDILKEAKYIGEGLSQGKNDYGSGGIIFGLFLAPKIKYCIVLDEDGILKEKLTFKGYNKKNIKVLDFLKMANHEDIVSKVTKPWKKSLSSGVFIPDEKDLQTKVFNSYCNLIKRQKPDENYLMHPYNGKGNMLEIVEKILKETGMLENDLLRELFDVNYTIIE